MLIYLLVVGCTQLEQEMQDKLYWFISPAENKQFGSRKKLK